MRVRSGGRPRVLVVINDLAPGGAQRAALDQAAGLDPSRYQLEVASLELAPSGAEPGDRFRHVPLRRSHPPDATGIRGWLELDRVLGHFDPDLVHGHLAAATVAGTLAARRRGVPRAIATFHNLTDWEEKRRHPLRLALRRTATWCDAVVAVSEAVRAAMARVDPALAARTRVIPNGIDLASFRSARRERDESRARLGYAADAFVVGAVARCDRRKGLDVLIEAAASASASVPSLRLLLVGDGPERSRLHAQAAARGLESRVTFAGRRSDVRPFLAAMDLFAAPSRTEGQGVALIEALACGLPVVGSRVGGIPEVVPEGRCGLLVAPGAPEALATAIAALARDPDRRAAMAGEASRHAERYALSEGVARLARLYDELLAPLAVEVAA